MINLKNTTNYEWLVIPNTKFIPGMSIPGSMAFGVIHMFQQLRGRSPRVREISEVLGISMTHAKRGIRNLTEIGAITKEKDGTHRNYKLNYSITRGK